LHQKSKCHGTKPFSLRDFQRHQEHDLKHLGLVDLITTKQNKLPSLIDRFDWYIPNWEVFHLLPFCLRFLFGAKVAFIHRRCKKRGDQPWKELAKSSYKTNLKCKVLIIFHISSYTLKTNHRQLGILFFFNFGDKKPPKSFCFLVLNLEF